MFELLPFDDALKLFKDVHNGKKDKQYVSNELIRSIDEFYEKDELTQNKISKVNLILHEL